MKVLVTIDGAGDLVYESEEAYAARYNDSWTSRLYDRATHLSIYFQGPRVISESIAIHAGHVADWIFANTNEDDEIGFAGYSRGGVCCILAAYNVTESWLYSGQRNVTAIGLLDPVSNEFGIQDVVSDMNFGSTQIRIARRSPIGGMDALLFPPLELESPNLLRRDFPGTHGDIGGTTDTANMEAYRFIGEFLADMGYVNFSSP